MGEGRDGGKDGRGMDMRVGWAKEGMGGGWAREGDGGRLGDGRGGG